MTIPGAALISIGSHRYRYTRSDRREIRLARDELNGASFSPQRRAPIRSGASRAR